MVKNISSITIILLFGMIASLYAEECELVGPNEECLKKSDCYIFYEKSIDGMLGSDWTHHRGRDFGLAYRCGREEEVSEGVFRCYDESLILYKIPKSHRWLFQAKDEIFKIDKCPSYFSSSEDKEMSIFDYILLYPDSIEKHVDYIYIRRNEKEKVLDVKKRWKYHQRYPLKKVGGE